MDLIGSVGGGLAGFRGWAATFSATGLAELELVSLVEESSNELATLIWAKDYMLKLHGILCIKRMYVEPYL